MPPKRDRTTGRFKGTSAKAGSGQITVGYAQVPDNNHSTNTGIVKVPVKVPNMLVLDSTGNTHKGTGRKVQLIHKK